MHKDYEGLSVSTDNHVAEMRLTRPEMGNVIDHDMHSVFPEVLGQLAMDRDIRAVVFCADGKVFSGGGDFNYIKRLATDKEFRSGIMDLTHGLYNSFAEFTKPIVVALQGDAAGIGATLVGASDVVVAAKSARLMDPHVVVGLGAGDGGIPAWASSVGVLRAKRHLLTGDALNAELAYQLGLVTDLVETPEDTYPKARKIAQKISALPPVAVQATMRGFNQYVKDVGAGAFNVSMVAEVACLDSEDLLEAIDAAIERRAANYKGV